MKVTRHGIEIIEDNDPIEGNTREEAIGFVIGQLRRNMNRIAEVLDKMQDQIDAACWRLEIDDKWIETWKKEGRGGGSVID